MTPEDRTDAEIDEAIRENLARTHYGQVLAARGIALVSMNDDGQLVRHDPDGSTTVLN